MQVLSYALASTNNLAGSSAIFSIGKSSRIVIVAQRVLDYLVGGLDAGPAGGGSFPAHGASA